MTIEDLKNVPQSSGVYLWKDKFNNIIYVGKAKNLNARMKQYFKGMLNSYKTATLVQKINSFEYFITNTNREALVLERNLIEKHLPEFNIRLVDNKRYPYIKLSLNKTLDISLVYRVRQDRSQSLFYGPFPSGYGARKMVNFINRLTTYKDGLPYKTSDKNYWKEKYDLAKSILNSKSNSLLKKLEAQMQEASNNMQYEVAANIKEIIDALKQNQDGQNVEFLTGENIDVIGFFEKDGYLSISLLFYRYGSLLSKRDDVIEIVSGKSESIRQYISQFYSKNLIPDFIISNEEIESNIKIIKPSKGVKKQILSLALKNAQDNIEIKLSKYIRQEEKTLGSLRKLESILGIKKISHILMIDNSNTNNTDPVSAIVSYRNGIKQRNEYRKYRLEKRNRSADVDYMNQGVQKYFKRNKALPDLFIVDGGIAQINEVKKIAPPDLKIVGLVKNDKHITEALIDLELNRINIEDSILLNFLKEIQIEVDRYAKTYHRQKRSMRSLEGMLSQVEGVGPFAEKKLLEKFENYSNIYNASLEELTKVVSENVAKKIIKKMRGE